MKLLIDNFDGAGVRDYTAFLDAEQLPRIVRTLNRGERLAARLVAESESFVVPRCRGRIQLEREDGHKLFTGYLTADPQYEYLGWGERGPVFRYVLEASGDSSLLDSKLAKTRPAFVNRKAGEILRGIAADLDPSVNVSAVEDLDTVASFAVSLQKTFSEHGAELARLARGAWRMHDGALSFAGVGAVSHTLDEADDDFSPERLKVRRGDSLINDVTVIGRVEPRNHVKNYFLGDGLTLGFNLSHSPFTRRAATLLEEEFLGASLDASVWTKTDPASAVSVSSGRLVISGGTSSDGGTVVRANELLELGGALTLQHGEVSFTGASNGVIGGLYAAGAAILPGNCAAGFSVVPSGGQSTIRALINGAETGPGITTVSGRSYALTTRVCASEQYRSQQLFHSSEHPAGTPRGGASVLAGARFVLEVHELDPANPGSFAASSTILYDGVLSSTAGFFAYALVNVASMQCSIAFTRLLRAVSAEVRSTPPGGPAKTRLVGTIAEGAECLITTQPELQFFSSSVPVPNEAIVVRYRSRGRALARVVDAASIAAEGERKALKWVAQPAPRTSNDCETAALALLDDTTEPAYVGEYSCWSDFLPNGAGSDPLPGDAVAVACPSRELDFTAIVREVEVAVDHLEDDRSTYTLRFANDAAEPLAVAFEEGRLSEELDAVSPGASFISDLPSAEITAITSISVSMDMGVAAPSGGGFEVRRSDFAWGAGNDRNLVGRFTSQTFSVPRLARVQTFHVKQYDAGKYSRYATVLHVDYPL